MSPVYNVPSVDWAHHDREAMMSVTDELLANNERYAAAFEKSELR